MNASQRQRVLDALKRGETLTQNDCNEWRPGIGRLGARIEELRKRGHEICTINEKNSSGRGYHARYKLIPKETVKVPLRGTIDNKTEQVTFKVESEQNARLFA